MTRAVATEEGDDVSEKITLDILIADVTSSPDGAHAAALAMAGLVKQSIELVGRLKDAIDDEDQDRVESVARDLDAVVVAQLRTIPILANAVVVNTMAHAAAAPVTDKTVDSAPAVENEPEEPAEPAEDC
jgi:hypothetical protein